MRGVIVVLTLSRHRDDVDVQAECLRVLATMCSGNDENRRVAGRHGAIQAVVDAMKHHGENENVQRSGCAALMSMTRHGGNENVRKKGYGNFVASLLWWLASLLWWLRRTNKSPTRR